MSKEERYIRLKLATEIIDRVFTDMCHDQDVTREETYELCTRLNDWRYYIEEHLKP